MLAYQNNMRQDATYWPPGINDGFGGTTHGAPEPVKCRWEERSVLFRDPQANEIMSSAVVYVPRELEIGGYLKLGVSTEAAPATLPSAYKIQQRGQIPDLTQSKALHTVWLSRVLF